MKAFIFFKGFFIYSFLRKIRISFPAIILIPLWINSKCTNKHENESYLFLYYLELLQITPSTFHLPLIHFFRVFSFSKNMYRYTYMCIFSYIQLFFYSYGIPIFCFFHNPNTMWYNAQKLYPVLLVIRSFLNHKKLLT